MSDDFIELGREFVEFDPNQAEEQVSRYVAMYWGKRLTWADVLKVPCTVVFAEGGSGKTQEFQNKAKAMLRAGATAFYCALNELAESALKDCLEVGDEKELLAWKKGDGHATFFLDSVDEAKLSDLSAFKRALRLLRLVQFAVRCRERAVNDP